jgi:uncharacterized repeat protein (TIGR01451 family)
MRRRSAWILAAMLLVLGISAGNALADVWRANLTVDLTASKGSGTVTYTVVVQNLGDDDARDVRMSFAIESNLAVSSITAGSSFSCASALEGSFRSVVCYKNTSGARFNLGVSASVTVTIVISNPTNGATIGNAQAESIAPDAVPSNNYDTASTL